MQRLSALDASFLYGETPETPMHVAGLGVFDPPPDGRNPYEAFRAHIGERLHLLPFFHRKLALSPIQLDHPVWIEDEAVDLDYHIRHLALPTPGSDEQLRKLVAQLHMMLLDRDRPLWRYYVIEGLQGGRFAIYTKMHHAGIDGGAGMAALETIFSATPEPPAVPPPPPRKKEAPPNIFELISDSYAHFFNQQRQFFESWPDIGKALASASRRLVENAQQTPALSAAPKTIFNTRLSSQRSFGTCSLSLAEAKAVGKAVNAKLNDVVMTISAGALRRYLQQRDALPAEPLITAVPVSLREAGNADMNNQVTVMMVRLHTEIADPIERLKAIVGSAQESKGWLGDFKDVLPRDVSWFGAPIIITGMARMLGQPNVPDNLPPIMNVLISNVPGPRTPMYCAGARMLEYYPVSIPAHGSVLNITVQSYVDRLDFGLIGCGQAVPDINTLTGFLVLEFEALKHAVLGGQTASAEPAAAAEPTPPPRSKSRAKREERPAAGG